MLRNVLQRSRLGAVLWRLFRTSWWLHVGANGGYITQRAGRQAHREAGRRADQLGLTNTANTGLAL